MRSLAFHLLRSDADADDAAQETLARALATARRPDATRPWLAGVLRNVVRRGARDRTRRTAREARVARPEALPATADFVAREQILRRVADAVLALDEPQRVVVLLRHYEGLPPREIAARLGTPVETVKSRLKRAHERLRETLDEGRRGNVEGWRSALGGLVGLAPDGTPRPGGTAGGLPGVGRGRAAGAGAKGGTVMASKTVVAAAVAAFVLGLGGVLVWKAPWRSGDDRGVPTNASHESAGRVVDDRAPALAAPPRPVGGTRVAGSPPADAPSSAAPTATAAGPAAGWKRWTVGSIQLDLPDAWMRQPASPDDFDRRASWATTERPIPHAGLHLSREGADAFAGLLADSTIVSSESIVVAGRTATLRVVDPKKAPPGVNMRALLVTVDAGLGDGSPLALAAMVAKEQIVDLDATSRAIFASVRIVGATTGAIAKLPSAVPTESYEGETPSDVLEGVVLVGGRPYADGTAQLTRVPPRMPVPSALAPSTASVTTTIGSDGRFRFEGLGIGLRVLRITPLGVSPRELRAAIEGPPRTNRRVVLVLGGSTVEGHVFDREGRPAADALVRLARRGKPNPNGDDVAIATTDRDGAYRADHLLAGGYDLYCAIGKDFRQGLVSVSGAQPVTYDLGTSKREPKWTGTVRRRGGAAVPGPGMLFLSGVTGREGTAPATLEYDAEGRFSGPVPTGTFRVRVNLPQPYPSVLLEDSVTIGDSDTTKDLELPDGRIRGRLVEESTHAAPPRDGTEAASYRVCLRRVGATVIQMDLCAKVENDGTFRFDFVPAGRYEVTSTATLVPGPNGEAGTTVVDVTDDGRDTGLVLEVR